MEKKRKRRRLAELTLELDRSSVSQLIGEDSRQASFIVLGGLEVGNTIPINNDRPTILGRDQTCDGVIRDDGISRKHAEVTRVGTKYVIVDLGSTNGLFVDGKRVERCELSEGQKVLLGRRTILKFAVQDKLDEQFQKQMYESSVRDALTGAFNRKHFDDRILSELSFATRHEVPLTLVIFDLDHFKRINDTYGHLAGDQVLSTVSGVVGETLRVEDIFARYGGEEFAIIARGITDIGGLALGERVRRVVEEVIVNTPDGSRIPVTISAGVATLLAGGSSDAKTIIGVADKNLYEAKESGRNRVVASRVE